MRDTLMIWLELRVTTGRAVSRQDEVKVADIIETAIDVEAQRVFCDSEENFMYCYIRFDEARVPVSRLEFYRGAIRQAFQERGNQSLSETNVVDEQEVAEYIPEAV